MRPLTRRHALHAAAALLTGLAGCSGSNSGSGSIDSGTPTAMERAAGDRRVTDPEQYTLRGPVEKQVVRTASDEDGDDDRDERRWRNELVASAKAADALTFVDVDDADGARAFLDETDFQNETIYVEQNTVGECWNVQLCHVAWGPDKIETDYSRTLRPVDAACSTDQRVTVVSLIRIPEALDPDAVHEHASSMGGRCRVPSDSRDDGAGQPSPAEGTNVEVATETTETTEASG